MYDNDQYSFSCLNEENARLDESTLKFINGVLMEEKDDDLENASPSVLHESFYSCLKEENDRPDATLKFINDMLMEEEGDLENTPSMLRDCLALQATERAFYNALHNNSLVQNLAETEYLQQQGGEEQEEEQRSNKQLAVNHVDKTESLDLFDKVLLSSDLQPKETKKAIKTKRRRKGRNDDIYLPGLLIQCAQGTMSSLRMSNAYELLQRIKDHSCPRGNHTERVAHYFAKALDARLAGTGTTSYAEFNLDRLSAVDILGAFKACFTSCPYMSMTILLANKTIEKLAEGSTTLHIIDFGILYGFQWPSLIQALSERCGGPPKLRITGIELPQMGHRPAQRVEETGRRLAKYCERFGVPFEYNAIAQAWNTIRVEDIKMEKDELRVVGTLNRLQNMQDEEEGDISQRDVVLNLIKNINPHLFIHGIINGPYSTPFFFPRFREALHHFSAMFDMLEATLHREDPQRLLIEQIQGSEVMNILACEGMDRIERPETFRQWHVRNLRAGFRQLPFDQEIMNYVRRKEETYYHKGFSMEVNMKWILHCWKGRVIRGISCWKPAHD